MSDDRWQEKTFLLMATGAMLVLTVFSLRAAVRAEDAGGDGIFKMFALILLMLVAVCLYLFVRTDARR